MKYSKETQLLKKQIQKIYKDSEPLGGRCTVSLHTRSKEEQQMVNEVAPTLGLSRDENAPTCWKTLDSFWFYIFDYRPPT